MNPSSHLPNQYRNKLAHRLLNLALVLVILLNLLALQPPQAASAATLLSVNFNSSTDGFSYLDDPFATSQPNYASGARTSSGGFGGSGGLQVSLGGIDANAISGISGGWSYPLTLAAPESGVTLSFRYKLDQTATYEFDEFSRVLVKFDTTQFGRGTKSYVDHIGGDGSSTQGNSSSFLPTTDWQQASIFLGNLSAGNHTLLIGGYNNKKDASDEATTLVIDDVSLTSGTSAPSSDPKTLATRLSISQYLAYIQGVAQFDDRCRGSGMSCSSTDYTTNYMNALAWVESQLQAMGYSTVRHNFNYNGNTGTNLWATKLGSVSPTQMYMVSAHLDARSGGDGFDDDGSGVALVMELARVLSAPDVTTDKSVRFIFWDKEEVGLYGAYGYVQDRRSLQGTTNEPTWLGIIQHDMILYDHGAGTRTTAQSSSADLDVEWRAGTTKEADSRALALQWRFLNGDFSTDYPATAYNYSTNTDDTPFHPYVASVSVRENRRSLTSGGNAEWINPYYHTTSDIESSYTRDDDADGKRDDIELGFNAVQATFGTVATLAGAHITVANNPPTANPQSVSTNEDTAKPLSLTGSDPDGNPLTYRVTRNPSFGLLTGNIPDLTYTPNANYSGPDSFDFVANDGLVDSLPATVDLTIDPLNDPPIANPGLATTTQGTPVNITLTGSDIEANPLTFSISTNPANGNLGPVVGSSVTYTPNPGFAGPDSFQYVANDGAANSAPAVVSIEVLPANLGLPFVDDFENDLAWTVNPNGTDGATSGAWERGDPAGADFDGPKQLDLTPSGQNDLVTGRLAGNNANSFDLDGGITSIQSPLIQLPTGQEITLSFKYYLAHARNATSADYLRVRVLGSSTVTILEIKGSGQDIDAAWMPFQVSLNSFAGQSVRILVEAADLAKASLVEAAIDDLSITAAPANSALLSANFDSSSDGFTYLDDAFRGTAQPAYADGAYLPTGGVNGGGLRIFIGGVDTEIVQDISGGWESSFTLPSSGNILVSFWFKLTQSADYESEELSQVLFSIDGLLYGIPPNDHLAQLAGNGNGGVDETTGWQLVSLEVGPLTAGTHLLTIGGYNNQKSYDNEWTEILVDQVSVDIP
jgi:hypothetical protein